MALLPRDGFLILAALCLEDLLFTLGFPADVQVELSYIHDDILSYSGWYPESWVFALSYMMAIVIRI